MQPVRIFQYEIISQQGYASTKYAISRFIPVRNIQPVGNGPVQNIQAVGIFQHKKGYQNKNGTFSLTVITLTVHMAVFEYQNQVIFNMTVFDVGPSLSYLHLLLVSKQKRCFWNTESKSIFNMTLLEGRSQCQTKT
jgi:hypothetical protein